jgi:hypothetical protein
MRGTAIISCDNEGRVVKLRDEYKSTLAFENNSNTKASKGTGIIILQMHGTEFWQQFTSVEVEAGIAQSLQKAIQPR